MKLGLVGSRQFFDKALVRKVVTLYRNRFGSDLVVVSGGANGADRMAKEVALEDGVVYIEFPPAHNPHNPYCVNPPDHYNRPFDVANFFARNTEIAEYCDHVLGFVVPRVRASGTYDTIHKADGLGKFVKVFSSAHDTSGLKGGGK